MKLPRSVLICEVAPRDGLQNEKPLPVADRVCLIDALSTTGLRAIQAGAFVHPDAVPQMAGTEEVFRRIDRAPGVAYSALVPNIHGAALAVEAGADEIEVVLSASDTHNMKNVRRSTDESLARAPDVITLALDAGIPVRGTVATAFGCPYEGDINPVRVARIAAVLSEAGCATIGFGDTTGMATPTRVEAVLEVLPDQLSLDRVSIHLHDTRGAGLANLLFAIQAGVTTFDASIGGLGGCPYAPGATGNIVTEDAVCMLGDMGVDCGVDLDALLACAALAQKLVGHELASRVFKAGPRNRLSEA